MPLSFGQQYAHIRDTVGTRHILDYVCVFLCQRSRGLHDGSSE
jgi:hypothetical protein